MNEETIQQPSILRSCSQIRRESRPIYYQQTKFAFVESGRYRVLAPLMSWLDSIGTEARSHITFLHLYLWDPSEGHLARYFDMIQSQLLANATVQYEFYTDSIFPWNFGLKISLRDPNLAVTLNEHLLRQFPLDDQLSTVTMPNPNPFPSEEKSWGTGFRMSVRSKAAQDMHTSKGFVWMP